MKWLLLCTASLIWSVSGQSPTCQLQSRGDCVCGDPNVHSYCGSSSCAPENRLNGGIQDPSDYCRNFFRFADDHILPEEWELLFDSYDYQDSVGDSVGSVFLRREFDSDTSTATVQDSWIQRGGICQRDLRACAFGLPGQQDNWLFSTHIKYPPGSTTAGGGYSTEVYLNITYRFTECVPVRRCFNNFVTLYRYNTNSIASETAQTNNNNYLSTPLFGQGTENTDSRFQQSGRLTNNVVRSFTTPGTTGFHLGIRDTGTCGQVGRILLYYTPCKNPPEGLVNYPELVRPPEGSPPNVGEACCAPNSHNTTNLSVYAYSASDSRGCDYNVTCECDAGYRLNGARTGCNICPAGTYRSFNDPQSVCNPCPMNTVTDVVGAGVCECLPGYHRDDNITDPEGPEINCTASSSRPRDLEVVTITDTTVTVRWTRPEVTGRDDFYYTLQYSDPDNTGAFLPTPPLRIVNQALSVSYTVRGLRSNTCYTIRVTSHNGVTDQDPENAALRIVNIQVITMERAVRFMLGGNTYNDGGIILITDIGEGENALLCVTDSTTCCSSPIGNFYYPDGTSVEFSSTSLYINRDSQLVRLNIRGNELTAPTGRYRCEIPDSSGTTQNIFINIATVTCPICTSGPSLMTCPPIPSPTPCPSPMTCPPIPSPTPCPSVTCPTIPTPTPCPSVMFPLIPTPTPCPSVMCPPIPTPTSCPSVTYSNTLTTTTCPMCPVPTPSPHGSVVRFMLGGTIYDDGDSVLITDIGEGDDALLCVTDSTTCCQTMLAGELYYPDGRVVNVRASGDSFYRNRGDGLIRLNRRNGALSSLGRYRCEIPDSSGTTQSIYINIINDTVTCPPTPCPSQSPVTCPPIPTPTPCPFQSPVTCPPIPSPTPCPPAMCPTTPPSTTTCPEVDYPTTSAPTVTPCPPQIDCETCPTSPCPTTTVVMESCTNCPPVIPEEPCPVIPSGNFSVFHVGENLFLWEGIDLELPTPTTLSLRSVEVSRRKRQDTPPQLNVNVTIDPDQKLIAISRANFVDGETYNVQAELIVGGKVIEKASTFSFTYRENKVLSAIRSTSVPGGYVDASNITVAVVLTFLLTAIIVTLFVIVLGCLYITCQVKRGYYTVNKKEFQKGVKY